MVKAFIKQWLFIFGLVVISAFIVPSIFNGYWDNTLVIIQLLVATLTICLLNFLLDKLPIELPLLRHFVNMCTALIVIFIYGWFWKWYTVERFWIILIMVIPVYVLVVLVDAVKIKNDVELINKHIQDRKQKRQEERRNDS